MKMGRMWESAQTRNSSVGQKLLAGLKLLRRRWFGASKKRS